MAPISSDEFDIGWKVASAVIAAIGAIVLARRDIAGLKRHTARQWEVIDGNKKIEDQRREEFVDARATFRQQILDLTGRVDVHNTANVTNAVKGLAESTTDAIRDLDQTAARLIAKQDEVLAALNRRNRE